MIVTNEDLLEDLQREQARINASINQVNILIRHGDKFTATEKAKAVGDIKSVAGLLAKDYNGATRSVVEA